MALMLLSQLAGQDHATGALLRALASGRVPHAYLFEGPSGVGKRSAAIGLGLALACPKLPRQGCGQCDVCQRILAGNHPDVRVVVPETAHILIEQAQQIVAMAAGRPHEAAARVIILDDADRLNTAAANCLLKTLEEPAVGNHLILVTGAPDRLLATIRSRTQRIRFAAVPTATLVQIAVARGIDRARAETAAALAGGSVARTLELVSGEADKGLWDVLQKLRDAATQPGVGAAFEAAASFGDKESKEGLPEALSLLCRFYRDATVAAVGADDLVLLRGQAGPLEALAQLARKGGGARRLRHAWGAVIEAQGALAANVNAVAVLERMLMEMAPVERARVGT